MLFFSLKLGKKIPFKIYGSAAIKIKKSAKLNLNGRLNIGLKKNEAVVSVLPVNLFLGNNSNTSLGHSVCLGPGVNIIVKDNASLIIGNGTYFTSDLHLEAEQEIKIGENCAISWGTTIIDSNHHHIILENKKQDFKGKVLIGNHVWIGCNVTILKDSIIGDNSIVAAGSIVRGSFPPNSLIVGNPAVVAKSNINWE